MGDVNDGINLLKPKKKIPIVSNTVLINPILKKIKKKGVKYIILLE